MCCYRHIYSFPISFVQNQGTQNRSWFCHKYRQMSTVAAFILYDQASQRITYMEARDKQGNCTAHMELYTHSQVTFDYKDSLVMLVYFVRGSFMSCYLLNECDPILFNRNGRPLATHALPLLAPNKSDSPLREPTKMTLHCLSNPRTWLLFFLFCHPMSQSTTRLDIYEMYHMAVWPCNWR